MPCSARVRTYSTSSKTGSRRAGTARARCCPMLGVLSLSGIFASERVLIPISTDYLAMRGAVALDNTLRALEHVLKHRVERRYLLTRFDARRRMSHDIATQLST